MPRRIRTLSALGALLVAAATLSACGGGIPGNAVATVDGTPITLAAFNHWMVVANDASAAGTGAATHAPVPDAPTFRRCIAYHQATDAKPAKGKAATPVSTLRSECQQAYQGLLDQVMQFLISSYWLQGEAHAQGVKVSTAQVLRQFNTLKQQQFPNVAQYRQFLTTSGMTQQDLLYRVRLNQLSSQIQAKVTHARSSITPAQIATYYNQNKARFGSPERRDLRIVLTKTLAQANAAKAAIAKGESFKKVASKFSIDPSTKSQGGALLGVVKGQEAAALDAAVFSAPLRKLQGPIKTTFGYYIFQVQKITPATQQSLKSATPTIRQLLASQGQQGALNKFVQSFNKRWKSRTKCRTGYVTQDCSNAPKSSGATGPTAAPGG